MPFVVSLGLLAVWAVPAHAASTRVEYAAQAEPICRAEAKDTSRLWKHFVQADRHFKFHAAGNALEGIGSRIAFSNTQLRLIPPPSGDEATIAGWLGLWDGVAQHWTQGASAYRLGKTGGSVT